MPAVPLLVRCIASQQRRVLSDCASIGQRSAKIVMTIARSARRGLPLRPGNAAQPNKDTSLRIRHSHFADIDGHNSARSPTRTQQLGQPVEGPGFPWRVMASYDTKR